MVLASELLKGMIIRVEGEIYRVLEAESKAAIAKLGGVVKAELSNVRTGNLWEARFRPQERLEDLPVERYLMEFLFRDGDTSTFMNSITYEQVEVLNALLGPAADFLQSGDTVPIEFFQGQPISALVPDILEAKITDTTPPAHSQQDSAWKEARLENGIVIRVPLFIGPGEHVRVDVRTGRYVERGHTERKRVA